MRGLRRRLLPAALLLVCSGVWFWLKIPCPVRSFLKIPCPGCGMTRAVLALLRGDVGAAFRWHPMVWAAPILPVLLLSDGKLTKYPAVNWALLLCPALGFLGCYLWRIML